MTSATPQHSAPSAQRLPGRLRLPTSLRSVLIIAFALLSVIPVGVALTVAIVRTSAQARQQVAAQMNSVVQLKLAAIESNIANAQTLLRTATHDEALNQNVVTLLQSADADAALQVDATNELNNFIDVKGSSFTEYFVYNRQGAILVSTANQQVGKLVRTQPYFNPSLAGEYVQPPYYEIGSNSLVVILTEPVIDDSGKTIGVLAGRFNLNDLAALMTQRAGLGETGETYLVSPENNYLLTPSRFSGYALNHSYHSQAIDGALAGKSGSGEYVNYRGKEVIGAYQWLPDLQVGLIAEYERAEALAPSQQAALASLIVAVAAAVVGAVGGSYIALRITQPITELTQVTQKLAEGDLSVRASGSALEEIGVLSGAFNGMAARLEENLTALQASVKEARLATAMAREANRLKSEFLAMMSHELRTPLNATIGFAELLMAGLSGELNEKQFHKVERIHLNSRRLLELINDLLDLAKIEAGRVDVVHAPYEPARMIASIQAQTESLAEKKGLKFIVTGDPNLPPVLVGDEARIVQVVNNLLSNAFKFTAKGEVELRVHVDGAQAMELSVRDTGVGIPPHALEYIFEEFRQVDSTSQRAYSGSGLGLSIARNLARIMGGELRVTSTLGEGSTFTVTLPMVTPETMPELIA